MGSCEAKTSPTSLPISGSVTSYAACPPQTGIHGIKDVADDCNAGRSFYSWEYDPANYWSRVAFGQGPVGCTVRGWI